MVKSCWNVPEANTACGVAPGILPYCLWEGDSVGGVVAGVIDGAANMVTDLYQLIRFVDCWFPVTISFWTDNCKSTRQKTVQAVEAFGDLIDRKSVSELALQVMGGIGQGLSG